MAIVIPCYNEAKRIAPQIFLNFLEQTQGIQFFFSNDGSTDKTHDLLEELCSQSSKAHFFHFKKNQGKGEVIRQSVQQILKRKTSFDYLGFWDADLATPLNDLEEIQRMTDEFSYQGIFCSRVKRLGGPVERKMMRHLLGRLFSTCVSFMLDLPIYDTQCGAKVFKASCATTIFQDAFVSQWFFDVELFFRLKKDKHLNLYEKPVSAWRDVEGSKVRLRDFLKTPLELFKIYFHYIHRSK